LNQTPGSTQIPAPQIHGTLTKCRKTSSLTSKKK